MISTIDNEKRAHEFAEMLIEKKLAACVSISSPIVSHYMWKNKKEKSKEYFIIIKTSPKKYEEIKQFFKKYHPYTIAEILTLNLADCNEEYQNWAIKQMMLENQDE